MDSTKYRIEGLWLSDNIVGQGAYGIVRKGYTSDGVECAVKITHPLLVESSPKYKVLLNEMTLHEAHVMSKLPSHSNLVQFKGLYYPPSNKDTPAGYPPYLVMELCHKGTLQSCIKNNPHLSLQTRLSILHDIAKGLRHLHSYGFIHCDLTPRNILLTETFEAKIGDLGATKLFEGKNLTDCAPGMPGYMGPEAKGAVCSYNTNLDIYSFGCVVLFTISGRECTDDIEKWLRQISPWPLLQKLAKECLQDPQKRPTAGQICEHFNTIRKLDFSFSKKFHLKVIEEGYEVMPMSSDITDFLASLASDLPSLNETMVTKHISKSCAESFLYYPSISDSSNLVKNGCIDLVIDTFCTASSEIMLVPTAGKQLSIRQSQAVFTGSINESAAESSNYIFCSCSGFDKPLSNNSAFAKHGTTMSCSTKICYDETDIAVTVLSFFMYMALYSLEPLLYIEPFDDISSKQKCTIRPYLLEGDNACNKSDISKEDELSASSSSSSCHKKHVIHEVHYQGNDRRLPSDSTLFSNGNAINAKPKLNVIIMIQNFLLPVACFITFLFLMLFLRHTESFFVNCLSNSSCTPTRVVPCQLDIQYPPVVAQNSTLTKSDLYAVDELSSSALPLCSRKEEVSNSQCKLQDYSTNKTLQYGSLVCANNSSARLRNKCHKNVTGHHLYLSRFLGLGLFMHCFQYPFCAHHAYLFVNGSKCKSFRMHQLDVTSSPLAIEQNDVSSSRLPFTNGVVSELPFSLYGSKWYFNPHCKLQDQNTTVTVSINHFRCDDSMHMLINSSTANADSKDESKGFLFRKTSENPWLVLYSEPQSLVTLPPNLTTLPASHTVLPDHNFACNQTMCNNFSLCMRDGFTSILIKSEMLTTPSLTGTSESKSEQCFGKAYHTFQSLHNNDTHCKLTYSEFVTMSFHKLLDAILSALLDLTSMMSLPSTAKLLQLQNSAMVNVVTIFKFFNTHLPNIRCKFKIVALQHWLHSIIAFVTLSVYICVKWVLSLTLHGIKRKFQLQLDCCIVYVNKIFNYLLKNPNNFQNLNQQIDRWLLCKQQVVKIDLVSCLKHRHSSDSCCRACQENLFESCNMFSFSGQLYKPINRSLVYDISYFNFASTELASSTYIQGLLVYGKCTCISFQITIKPKTYRVTFCDSLTPSSEILPFFNHYVIASAESQLKGCTTNLDEILLYIHRFCCCENEPSYFGTLEAKSKSTLTLTIYIQAIFNSCCVMQSFLGSLYQNYTHTQEVSKVTQAMYGLNIVHSHKDQSSTDNDDDNSNKTGGKDNCSSHNIGQDGDCSNQYSEHDNHCENESGSNDHDGDHDNDNNDDSYDDDDNDNDDDDNDNDNDDDEHNDDRDNNHNDHGDEYNGDNNDNGGNSDDQDDDFALTLFNYCSSLVLLFLQHFYLISCHLFTSLKQNVTYWIRYVTHLTKRQNRVACIGRSYHNTFRPNSQVKATDTITAVFQGHLHLFRSRYGLYAILYTKLLANSFFQMLPQCHNEMTNFQMLWLVNMIEYHSIEYFQGNPPIIVLINVDERLQLIYLKTQRRQHLELLQHWINSGFPVTSLVIQSLCEVECGKSQLSIVAIECQNTNSMGRVVSTISRLKWIFDKQLHRSVKEVLTCTVQAIEVQNPMSNTAVICLLIKFTYFLEDNTFYSLAIVNAMQSDVISHGLVFLGSHSTRITFDSCLFIMLYGRKDKESTVLMEFITALTHSILNKHYFLSSFIPTLVRQGRLIYPSESTKEWQMLMQSLLLDHRGIQVQNNKHFVSTLIRASASNMFTNYPRVTVPNIHNLLTYPCPTRKLECIPTSVFDKPARAIQQNPYYFLREFVHENIPQSIFISNLLNALWKNVSIEEYASATNHSQLVTGSTTADCQSNVLELSDDDRTCVAEMVSGCVAASLRKIIEDEVCTQVVTGHTFHDISSHQSVQQKSTLNSTLGHGGNVLIQSNHVLPFPCMNAPLHHQPAQGADHWNQNITFPVNKNDEVASTVPRYSNSVESLLLKRPLFSFALMGGPKNSERTVFQEHEVTGKPPLHSVPVQATEAIPNKTLLVDGNDMMAVIGTYRMVIQMHMHKDAYNRI